MPHCIFCSVKFHASMLGYLTERVPVLGTERKGERERKRGAHLTSNSNSKTKKKKEKQQPNGSHNFVLQNSRNLFDAVCCCCLCVGSALATTTTVLFCVQCNRKSSMPHVPLLPPRVEFNCRCLVLLLLLLLIRIISCVLGCLPDSVLYLPRSVARSQFPSHHCR